MYIYDVYCRSTTIIQQVLVLKKKSKTNLQGQMESVLESVWRLLLSVCGKCMCSVWSVLLRVCGKCAECVLESVWRVCE